MNDSYRDDSNNDEFIAEVVEEFKAATPAPPAELRARVLEAVRAEHATSVSAPSAADAGVPHGSEPAVAETHSGPGAEAGAETGARILPLRPSTWPAPMWGAAGAIAATLIIASGLALRAAFFIPMAPVEADRLLVVDALAAAEAAEREHARAIEELELAVAPILAKADDPETPGADAARLTALGNQLRFIDQTILEIEQFLSTNSSHPGARATLLTAYTDKTEVLRSVVALDREITP